jgi:hypothetical protein
MTRVRFVAAALTLLTWSALGASSLDAQALETLPLGQTLTRTLVNADSGVVTGVLANRYRLQKPAGTVEITVTSRALDPYIRVITPGFAVFEDDDGGGGLNARVRVTGPAGDYVVIVSALYGEAGAYEVLAELVADSSESAVATTGADQCGWNRSASGVLTNNDALHPREFAIIREFSGDRTGGARGLSLSASMTDGKWVDPELEVDVRSRIVISWDRLRLKELARDNNLAFTVRARVEGGGESRQVQVSSYSTIGQQRRTTSTTIRTLSGYFGALCNLSVAAAQLEAAARPAAGESGTDQQQRIRLAALAFEGPLFTLRDTNSLSSLTASSLKSVVDPRSIAAYSRELSATLDSLLGTADGETVSRLLRKALVVESTLSASARAIRALDFSIRTELTNELLHSQLKDGDIYIPETGARPGDRIVIEIENDAAGDSIPRVHKVTLKVVEFGITQRTRDSFLLLNRIGVSDVTTQSLVATSPVADSAGATDVVSAPEVHRAVPTPGITYGWSYYPRNRDRTRRWAVVQWLHPGLGVNVSFVRFGTRIVEFQVADTANNIAGSVEASREEGTLDVAVGPILTLFDGAVQFSQGWNLSAGSKRTYWALGFSFLRLTRAQD